MHYCQYIVKKLINTQYHNQTHCLPYTERNACSKEPPSNFVKYCRIKVKAGCQISGRINSL